MTLVVNPSGCKVQSSVQESKFLLIRHLKTEFNLEMSMAEEKKNYNEICRIRFGVDYLDSEPSASHIKEMSRADCLKEVNIEKIYMSPLIRSLETCRQVLQLIEASTNQKLEPKIKVLPLLFEKIEDSCDISLDLDGKLKDYSSFKFRDSEIEVDWTEFSKISNPNIYQLAYCDNAAANDKICNSPVSSFNIIDQQEQLNALSDPREYKEFIGTKILSRMKDLSEQNEFIESYRSVSQRLKEVNIQILREQADGHVNELDKKVLIIGHSVLFHYWCTEKVYQDTLNPYYQTEKLENCGVVGVKIESTDI